jgi:hypothetical protein
MGGMGGMKLFGIDGIDGIDGTAELPRSARVNPRLGGPQ